MMKHSEFSFTIALACCLCANISFSQVPVITTVEEQKVANMQRESQEELVKRVKAMSDILNEPLGVPRISRGGYGIDKEARKRIEELRRPDPKDLNTYRSFLKTRNHGIFRLS